MERKYDFKEIENEILAYWRAHKKEIDEAIGDKNTTDKERFTFLEGPPTANAPPALHHVEMRVFKDLFTRFKTLQGYKVSRKGGWDCHGLPVEVQVEKKLGLGSKKEVLTYGVESFVEECKSDVFSFIKPWTESTERLGYWVDLDHPYKTLDTPFMESVWWALSEIYKKDLLYLGHKIVPYCARCGTPLSSHEVAQGYKDVEETTVVAKFPALDQEFFVEAGLGTGIKPVVFLAWTTTPWTLPSNLALAVHPKVSYAFVEGDDAVYVLAEDLVPKFFPDENRNVVGVVFGEKLVGQKYEPLFDYFKDQAKNSFRIIPADYVTTEDGTGIVHQAPAFGEDDNEVCKKNGIDFVNPVDDNGEFTSEVPQYQGMFVKDADKKILEDLESRGKVFTTHPYTHSYPFCWRCKTPLIYYAKDTWFIKVTAVKDQLIEQNETVNWYPESIKHGRFGNWLEGARDWALSRNKFWGTPLPIWVCENDSCDHQEVIGSIEELKEKTGVLVDDLHIGTVDPLTYKCPKCGGVMKRTSEVIDCWFDSGSAPFAQLHYPFENKDLFEELYPYDFIAEAIDQTRGWFYTLMVINTILFGKAPYKNVAVGGLLSDDNGEKMSKSKGNIINPDETFEKYGVDGVRLSMASYSLGNAIRYGDSIFKEQIQPFFTTFWNTYFYVQSYFDRFDLKGTEVHAVSKLEDEWMLSKTSTCVEETTNYLENHEYNKALETIMNFMNNVFSRTYIKLIRSRTNGADEELAYVFRHALTTATMLIAPFASYLSEKVYLDFIKPVLGDDAPWSIHFYKWPEPKDQNKDLEKEFDLAQNIIQGILAAREKAKRGVRWPVLAVKVLPDEKDGDREKIKLAEPIVHLIKEQTNVKSIDFVDHFDVRYAFDIDFRKLGEVFGTETGDVIPLVKKEMDMISKALNESDSVVVGKWTLQREYFKSEKIVPEPYIMAPFNGGEVYLDTVLTPELEREGYYREIARRVQNLRKTAGLQPEDRIILGFKTNDEDLLLVVEDFREDLLAKVGADEFEVNTDLVFDNESEEKVKGKSFTISLKKK